MCFASIDGVAGVCDGTGSWVTSTKRSRHYRHRYLEDDTPAGLLVPASLRIIDGVGWARSTLAGMAEGSYSACVHSLNASTRAFNFFNPPISAAQPFTFKIVAECDKDGGCRDRCP